MNELVKIDEVKFDAIVSNGSINFEDVKRIIKSRNNTIESIIKINEELEKIEMADYYLIASIVNFNRSSTTLRQLYSLEDQILNVDCIYWLSVLEMSKVREYMDYNSYYDMCAVFKTRNKAKHMPFTEENVIKFLNTLELNKDSIFATKIQNLIFSLSSEYKYNQGNALSALMVIGARANYGGKAYVNYEQKNLLKDFIYSIRQMFTLDTLNDKIDIEKLFDGIDYGDWYTCEHDLFRYKVFNNANIHIHLSDKLYAKICQVLAIINPMAIAYDSSKIKRKPYVYNGNIE